MLMKLDIDRYNTFGVVLSLLFCYVLQVEVKNVDSRVVELDDRLTVESCQRRM